MSRKIASVIASITLFVLPVYSGNQFASGSSMTAGNQTIYRLTGSNATFSLWIKATTMFTGGYGMMMSKWDGEGHGWIFWGVGTEIRCGDENSSELKWAGGVAAIQDGKWHHLACVIEGGSGTIYLDGVSKATGGTFSILTDATTDLYFGRYISDSGNLTSTLEDVRLYNRALTSGQIETLAKSRLRLNITDGLIGYWPMDDGRDGAASNGSTALDRSGYGFPGTFTNGTWRASEWLSYP